MDFMTRILVTGVSGMFGGEVARQLMAKRIPIRILVRDPSKVPQLDKSVEVLTGDFINTGALVSALNGIEKLYLASYDKPELVEHQANVLAIARQCEVQHVVRLSSAGTEENNELPDLYRHAVCERQLEESGLGFTHLKPMWVMQNFESFVVNDRIRLPAGEGPSRAGGSP
jgi:NAD(P)H dehydrogenase (quinone)